MFGKIDFERLAWRWLCGVMIIGGLGVLGGIVYTLWVEVARPIIKTIRETPNEAARTAGVVVLVFLVCFLVGWIADRLGFVPPVGKGAVEALREKEQERDKERGK